MGAVRMNLEEIQNALASAEHDEVPLVLYGAMSDLPITWDELFAHMSAEYFSENADSPKAEGAIDVAVGNMLIRGKFYYMTRIDPGTSYQHLTNLEAAVRRVNDFVKSSKSEAGHDSYGPAMSFISILNEPRMETEIHKDPGHTMFWQIQGESMWTFYEEAGICSRCNRDHPISHVTLRPGDLLFAPKGAPHTVITKGARAAIAFRSSREDEQKEISNTKTLADLWEYNVLR